MVGVTYWSTIRSVWLWQLTVVEYFASFSNFVLVPTSTTNTPPAVHTTQRLLVLPFWQLMVGLCLCVSYIGLLTVHSQLAPMSQKRRTHCHRKHTLTL